MVKKEITDFKDWLSARKIVHKVTGEPYVIDRIPTGAFALDLALDGGIPKNKVTEIYGDKAMGKTNLALHIAKHGQIEGMRVLYVDAENSLDKNNIVKNLDIVGLDIVIPAYLEQMGETVLHAVEEFDLVIIDSLVALPPITEYEGGLEKQQQAQAARVLGKFFRMLSMAMIEHDCTIVILNQVRQNMSMYGPHYILPGGKSQDFAASIQIELKSGTYEDIKDTQEDNIRKPDDAKRFNMKKTVFDIAKSRVSSPRRSGDIYFVIRKFKDYKAGDIYNAGIIRSYFRSKFLDLEWFEGYKTQEQLIDSVREYDKYKNFINICVQKSIDV